MELKERSKKKTTNQTLILFNLFYWLIVVSHLFPSSPSNDASRDLSSETARRAVGLSAADLDPKYRHPTPNTDCRNFRWFLGQLEPDKLVAGRVLGSGRLQQRDGPALAALTVAKQTGNRG